MHCAYSTSVHHIHNEIQMDVGAAMPQKRNNTSGIAGCTVYRRPTRVTEKVRNLLSGPASVEIQASFLSRLGVADAPGRLS